MYVTKYKDKYRAFERYVINGVPKKVSVVMEKDTPQARNKAREQLLLKKPINVSNITFKELRTAYIADKKVSTKMTTWTRDQGTLRRIGEKLDKVKVNSLTSGQIRQALLSLSSDPTTLNEYLKRLKTCLRWAYQNDFLSSTVCVDKIARWDAPTKRAKVKDKYLERDELKKVLDSATPYYGAIIEFLALSGLRIGELIALDKKDVTDEINVSKTYDYIHGFITTPKTEDSERSVAIQPELAECIRKINHLSAVHRMASGTAAPYFVVNPYGGRLSYAGFAHYFEDLTEKVAGKRLTPHALRHTHTSLLAEKGVPLDTISRRLGHSNSKITKEIYLHTTQKTLEKDKEIIQSVSFF